MEDKRLKGQHKKGVKMKYSNFRTIARVFVILAWLVGIIVFVGSLIAGIAVGGVGVILWILLGAVGGFLSFAYLYAFAQFIYISIDIERNTRATLRALLEEVEAEQEVGEGEGE
ncbi:MAG: hypothetical protein KAH98_04580 [Dehalococcoidia bacterium]|nr:hypothetical protein [Dehalococcoidia bacterium]